MTDGKSARGINSRVCFTADAPSAPQTASDKTDRSGPVKVADGSGWWIDGAEPRTIKKLPAFDPAKLAKAQADRAEVAKLLGWA